MSIQNPKIVFMGMNGDFSRIPFQAMVETGHEIKGLILPRPKPDKAGPRKVTGPKHPDKGALIPLRSSTPNLIQIAAAHDIPVFEVGSLRDRRSLELLKSFDPDLICVACFSRLLPTEWLETPPLGGLNLHPSLLPAYRGPSPLFWQFREGEENTGITLHFMDEGVDTGDIAAQRRVPFPTGITTAEADRLTAEAGAQLILETLTKPAHIPRTPQPEEGASYHPKPTRADKIIPTSWSAVRAFNFMRGAQGWGPLEIRAERSAREKAGNFKVWEALSLEAGAVLGEAYQWEDGNLRVQFKGGAVWVQTYY